MIGLIALAARKIQKTWFAPGAFFALIWFLHMALTLIFAKDFYLFANSNLIILFFVFITFLGSSLGMKIKARRTSVNTFGKKSIKKIRKLSIISSIIGFLTFPLILYSTGGSFSTLLNLESLMNLARENSIDRYSGDIINSSLTSVLLAINYFAAIMTGVSLSTETNEKGKLNKKLLVIYLLPIITSILIAAILTTKATILYTGILFLAGLITAKESLNPKTYLFTKKNLLIFLTITPSLLLLFVFIQMGRYGFDNINGMFKVIGIFKIWAFGHLSAFSVWFNQYYIEGNFTLTYGQYTFSGLFSILNIVERVSGIYSEGIIISKNLDATNIFTIFRGIIEDFGIIGAMIISFIVSFITGFKYKDVKMGRIESFVFLIIFYSFTLFGFVVSILSYNTILLAFIMFYIFSGIISLPIKLRRNNNSLKVD